MPDFDPYLKWLGIREKSLPVNHYRLLGLELFESDADVISMAADRQMTHIRTYQNGPRGDVSQEILNELARARRCLLMPEKKAEYDAVLGEQLSHPVAATASRQSDDLVPPPIAVSIDSVSNQKNKVPVVPPTIVPSSRDTRASQTGVPVGLGIREDFTVRAQAKSRESKQLWWSVVGWISGGLAAVGIGAALLGSGWLRGGASAGPAAEGLDSMDANLDRSSSATNGQAKNNALAQARSNSNRPSGDGGSSRVRKPNSSKELFRPDPSEDRFDLSNIRAYPKSDPNSFGLFGDVKNALREKKTVPLEASALGSGETIRILPDAGAVVIGLIFELDKKRNFVSVQPVFHDGFRAFAGDVLARRNANPARARLSESAVSIARPGYAVGEIEVSAVRPVRCIRIRYMKLGDKRMDAADAYFGKWIGRETGPCRVIQNPAGLPVVGVFASLANSGHLATIGLVGVDPNGNPEPDSVVGLSTTKFPIRVPAVTATIKDENGIDPFAPDPTVPIPPSPTSGGKMAEPDARARIAAERRLPESIQVTIVSANNIARKMRASRRLVSVVGSLEDVAEKYVVLKQAEALGIAAGDAQSTVEAIRAIDQFFEIAFWDNVNQSIDNAARNLNAETALDFKDTLDGLIEESRAEAEFNASGRLLSLAIKLSRAARNVEATSEYVKLEKRYKAMDELVESGVQALDVLAADPKNGKANRDRGDYLLVVEDEVGGALDHWSKSNDAKRVSIAELNNRFPQPTGAQMIELAEAWWKLGKQNRSLLDRKSLERAYDLYRKSSVRVPGDDRNRVDEKLKKLKALLDD